MKYFIVTVLFLIGASIFSESLNNEAIFIREKMPQTYEAIKSEAQEKWKDDPTMVLYTINKQCEAFVFFVQSLNDNYSDEEKNIFLLALYKWTIGGEAAINAAETPYFAPTDWVMVVYEIEKQRKALSQF